MSKDKSEKLNLTSGLFKDKAAASQINTGLSCVHLQALKNDVMISTYEMLYAVYVACMVKSSGRRKVEECVCHRCEKETSQSSKSTSFPTKRKLFRIQAVHACLSCVYFGCYKDKCHIKEHSKEEGHPLAMDTDCGQVYCFECGDMKYDLDFMRIEEELREKAKRRRHEIRSQVKPTAGKPDKWELTPELIELLKHHEITYNDETGIRGLYNFKFTCYINVIIQCLIHAPVFRDYLLSLQHQSRSHHIENHKKEICLICQMTDVLQKSFISKKQPIRLFSFLFGFFQRCTYYARREFEDAHDCFRDLLVNFHQDVTGSVCARECPFPLNLEMFSPCPCVIHEMFGFKLQRETKCDCCKHSTVQDSFESFISLTQVKTTNVTINDCLESTWEQKEFCGECKEPSGCTVKARPVTLPLILNIMSNQYDSKKNRSTPLNYEETLDLSPYILPSWKTKTDSLPEHMFYLFGVVEYDKGHYRCYVKKNKDQWFECDDDYTCPITFEKVLEVNVRLLFYHKMYM